MDWLTKDASSPEALNRGILVGIILTIVIMILMVTYSNQVPGAKYLPGFKLGYDVGLMQAKLAVPAPHPQPSPPPAASPPPATGGGSEFFNATPWKQ